MKKSVALIAALSIFSAILRSGVAFAAPQGAGVDAKKSGGKTVKKDDKKSKITEVWTCPMTGDPVLNKKDKGVVVGDKRVHFCCPECEPPFNKLSDKDKKAKVAVAAKKDAENAKKKKS